MGYCSQIDNFSVWIAALMNFPDGSVVKNLPANAGDKRVRSRGGEDPLEKEMATHFGILAWKIPWTEEPDGQQFIGSQRDKTKR